ncbi:glycoside hydrolase family 3 C-terminal domain-containing protein [Hephaestia mangrovi]|uniref:glycoside hydrolase family 3 C-terminal domain-containing protein n=1 Tax=Hephaestia mangrovi TaxID=2873268 RepID=UPI001CA6DE90|nr:glycoside hydrolase family 3 C-terminal domain-containing protein [Hephaestia mangrovi]MBY8827045.1 glycoside hydrolase family 3 C-terminal domain-containing protein [Hephaestia mangrovi]
MARIGGRLLSSVASVLALAVSPSAHGQVATAAKAVPDAATAKAEALVARMTLDEKLPQLLNVAPAIPRLGIPRYNWWTESLHGALGTLPTTNFPEPIGLAATFDPTMVKQVAGAISTEVRGLHTLARKTGRYGRIGTGLDTWSPNLNIFRDPRWGRGQETYGEDPFLVARMGVAFIEGMQGPDPQRPEVIATPKHFDVHSGPESTRHVADVFVSKHDLVDTYLPAFRAAITEAKAGSIMCAYNRIDGQPACANDMLLRHYLRGEWGFKGYVVSDCDAVKDISDTHHYAPDGAAGVAAAIHAGVDNECNTATLSDTGGLTDRYRKALDRGLISTADIDRALVRLFAARYRTGDLAGLSDTAPAVPASAVGSPAHGALALEAAEKSLVLLKNDGVLPLKPGVKVAVIGPLGDATRVLRGNYSSPLSGPPISVADGLDQVLSSKQVVLVPFGPSITDGDRVPTTALQTPDGKAGLLARYYNPVTPPPALFKPDQQAEQMQAIKYLDTPVATRIEPDVGQRDLDLAKVAHFHRTVWTGFLVPPESGTYRVGLSGSGGTLSFDGHAFVDRTKARWNDLPTMKTVTLEQGHRYPVTIDATAGVDLVWKRISTAPEADLDRAATNADVLVAVVGLTSDLEAEETSLKVPGFAGGDKTTLDLPADQIKLLEQAKATGKPLIVVVMNGSPIDLAWAKDNAAAIVEAWYPGQSGGLAVARVLAGKVDPGGRLPLTFYRSVADLPPFADYSMKGRTYRYFTGEPVYPFGAGLSYTSFSYGPLTVTPMKQNAANGLHVSTVVTNTGARAGDDVAQLYLNFPDVPGAPRIALRGFQRVSLKPGERRTLTFDLSPRDLSAVTADGTREVMPGAYAVTVGSGQPGTAAATQQAHFSVADAVTMSD